MGQSTPHYETHTDAGWYELCPCGEPSDCVWDSDDSASVALCAACYVARAKSTLDRLIDENRDDTREQKQRLLVQSNRNHFPTWCCDCGCKVQHGAGYVAWGVLSCEQVVVCQACTDERMADLDGSGRSF